METSRRLITSAAGVLAALVMVGCSSTVETQAGPLVLGSPETVPDQAICVSDVGSTGLAWFGDRATNDSDVTIAIESVEPQQADGLIVRRIEGRVMDPLDPHFAAFSDASADNPEFERALQGLQPVDRIILEPGEVLGLVAEVALAEGAGAGTIYNLKVTYRSEGTTYSSVTATSLSVSASECGN